MARLFVNANGFQLSDKRTEWEFHLPLPHPSLGLSIDQASLTN